MKLITNVSHQDLDAFLWDAGDDPVDVIFLHSGGAAIIHDERAA
jgi:hypothetical protein